MAPLLLKHLTTSLTRRVVQMSRFNLTWSSPAASTFRCLYAFTQAPFTSPLSSAKFSSIQQLFSGSSAHCGSSLPGPHLACIQPFAGMKTKSALKRRCKDCFFVRRRGHLFVFCKTNPRHKQRQG